MDITSNDKNNNATSAGGTKTTAQPCADKPAADSSAADMPDSAQESASWCALTGQRVFKSAHRAWEIYGQYRFAISQRTWQTYVGKKKPCSPRSDGSFYVEDIEIYAKSRAWPPASSFVRGATTGGEGETQVNTDIGAEIQLEKLLIAKLEREEKELSLAKKRKEVLPRKDYEQLLASAAAIVGNEAETFVYDHVREIIHRCGGKPEKEDSLREYLLDKVRHWLHAFSRLQDYSVELVEDEETLGDDNAGNLD